MQYHYNRHATADVNYLGFVEADSKLGIYSQYAVSTDAKPCAKIGSALLAKGGSAVDAAIGTLICMGIVIPNSLGIGGGCLMTIYNRSSGTAETIDGREIAPDYATEDMFSNNQAAASRGPLSIGVPGELAAYWLAHQKYGKLKWADLFQDNIGLAENGIPLVEHMSQALRDNSHAKYISPDLKKIYSNPETGKYLKEGEILVQKQLAESLRRIQSGGADEFYKGQTGRLFIDDLKQQGGQLEFENLNKYKVRVSRALEAKISNNLTLFTQPVPGSGIVLSVILRIMKELNYYKNIRPQQSFREASLFYHHLAEAFKYAYAQRAGLEDKPDDETRMVDLMNKLQSDEFIREIASQIDTTAHHDSRYGGQEYFKDDHGTAHVSVMDSDGNAVAITSSINMYFGSGLVSPRTGIVYNDIMDDFVTPNLTNKFGLAPSKFNRIRPGRRPISSMAPSVFVDELGNVRLVVGASGGSKITTAIATVSLRNLFFGEDIKTAIDGPRIHHQYLPDKIFFERNFDRDLLDSLEKRNHKLEVIKGRSSVSMAIANVNINGTNHITANSDYRKGGSVDGV